MIKVAHGLADHVQWDRRLHNVRVEITQIVVQLFVINPVAKLLTAESQAVAVMIHVVPRHIQAPQQPAPAPTRPQSPPPHQRRPVRRRQAAVVPTGVPLLINAIQPMELFIMNIPVLVPMSVAKPVVVEVAARVVTMLALDIPL